MSQTGPNYKEAVSEKTRGRGEPEKTCWLTTTHLSGSLSPQDKERFCPPYATIRGGIVKEDGRPSTREGDYMF
jgi:hypothetical protein